MRSSTIAIASILGMLSGAAEAHPRLLSVSPSPNVAVGKVSQIKMRFSEQLIPAFSKADLTMAAMPGMPAMKIPSITALADGRMLVVTPKAPLHQGRYRVAWHVVSTDTHKVAGSYVFAVK